MSDLEELILMERNDPMRKHAAKKAAASMKKQNALNMDIQEQELPRTVIEKMASVSPRMAQRDMSQFKKDLYGDKDPDQIVMANDKHGEVRHGDIFHAAKSSGMHPVTILSRLFE